MSSSSLTQRNPFDLSLGDEARHIKAYDVVLVEVLLKARIMRKLKSFSKAQVYFSDCAATAGGQIVVAPNGQVGICHGCLFDKEYFVATIDDDEFIAAKDPSFIEWSQLTPLNHEECHDCPALGICGGGCPINARNLRPGNTIHSIEWRGMRTWLRRYQSDSPTTTTTCVRP